MPTEPDADTQRPTLTLSDASGGTQHFALADTDAGPPADRLYFLYLTDGDASHLPGTVSAGTSGGLPIRGPAANFWTIGEMLVALAPVPDGSRVVVNAEWWEGGHHNKGKNGEDIWTPRDHACAAARLKAARPDLEFSWYDANVQHHRKERGATMPYTSFVTDSAYPGPAAKEAIFRIGVLMQTDPEATILTGYFNQGEGEPSLDLTRDVVRRLVAVGVTHFGVYDGPPNAPTNRHEDMIIPVAEIIVEEFDKFHGPQVDAIEPEPGADHDKEQETT